MDKPDNAHAFVQFMEQVWYMGCEPADNGVTLIGSDLYDKWHDATHSAKRCGAVRTGGTKVNGENWAVYRFEKDAGYAAVLIALDGNACALSIRAFGNRRMKAA